MKQVLQREALSKVLAPSEFAYCSIFSCEVACVVLCLKFPDLGALGLPVFHTSSKTSRRNKIDESE